MRGDLTVRLLRHHVVEQGVGGVARVIIVVAEQGKSVIVAAGDAGRVLDPGAVGRANSRQNRRRRAGGVVAQRRGRPIVTHHIRTGHFVPERNRRAAGRRGECLRNTRIAIGRTGAAEARRPAAGVPPRDGRRCSGRSPTAQRAGFKIAVHNSVVILRGADRDVIEHRVGRVADVIIVVTEKSQSVVVAGNQAGRDLDPGVVRRTNVRQNRGGHAGGVVAQGRGRPIVSHRVGTGHLVPKRELTARGRRGECLRDA